MRKRLSSIIMAAVLSICAISGCSTDNASNTESKSNEGITSIVSKSTPQSTAESKPKAEESSIITELSKTETTTDSTTSQPTTYSTTETTPKPEATQTTTSVTTKPVKEWNETKTDGKMYVNTSCYSRKKAVLGAEIVQIYDINDQVNITAKTDTGYYKIDTGAYIHSDYLSAEKIVITTTTATTVAETPKPVTKEAPEGYVYIYNKLYSIKDTTKFYFNSFEYEDFNCNRLSNADIVNISKLTNLTEIEIWSDDLSDNDIAPLAKLPKLYRIFLLHCSLSDISTLASFNKIKKLEICDVLSDISPLSKLTNLEYLDLSHTQITNIEPLSQLTNLEHLSLDGTQITNIEPLAKLTNLEYLGLSSTQITNIEPLAKLTKLKELYLYGNSISNLNSLSKLTKLETLDISQCSYTNLKPLSNLKNLEYLDISWTNVSDLSPLYNLKNLISIDIHDCENITAAKISKLSSHLPYCFIDTVGLVS